MDGYGEHNIGDHMEFVLWFAPKLARKYLEWCIEREAVNKCVAIAKCFRNNSPYSTCLTSATIRKSAAAAASADIEFGNISTEIIDLRDRAEYVSVHANTFFYMPIQGFGFMYFLCVFVPEKGVEKSFICVCLLQACIGIF